MPKTFPSGDTYSRTTVPSGHADLMHREALHARDLLDAGEMNLVGVDGHFVAAQGCADRAGHQQQASGGRRSCSARSPSPLCFHLSAGTDFHRQLTVPGCVWFQRALKSVRGVPSCELRPRKTGRRLCNSSSFRLGPARRWLAARQAAHVLYRRRQVRRQRFRRRGATS
jgi:hypothetical protein